VTAPTRHSAAGRVYLALRKKAKTDKRNTDELLQLAALEAFVDRMVGSAHSAKLVLKGGVLLAAYDSRRPTRDVDLSAQGIASDPAVILVMVQDILAIERLDGWRLEATQAEVIREEDTYSGVRVTVESALTTAKVTFKVDVNVGDVV
jgi:hypothetical protein